MKRNTKCVGLDVHRAMRVATVRSEGGRVIARCRPKPEVDALPVLDIRPTAHRGRRC